MLKQPPYILKNGIHRPDYGNGRGLWMPGYGVKVPPLPDVGRLPPWQNCLNPPVNSGRSNSGFTGIPGTPSTKTTGSLSWNIGDVVVVLGSTADGTSPGNQMVFATPTSSGSGLSFSLIVSSVTNSNCTVYAWKATATAISSGTISAVETNNAGGGSLTVGGIQAWVFSGSSGVGNNGTPNVGQASTSPSNSLIRGSNNSAVVWIAADWNAVVDSTATSSPSTGATQRAVGINVSAQYTVWTVDWTDQGVAGTTSYGLTGAGNGKWTSVAVEVKGVGAIPPYIDAMAHMLVR